MSIISKKSLLGQKKKEKREAENNSQKESNKPKYVHKHKLTFWEKIPVVSGFVRLITNTSIINVIKFGFVILLVNIVINAFITYMSLGELEDAFSRISNRATPLALEAKSLESNLLSIHNQLNQIIASKKPEEIDKMTAELDELKLKYKDGLKEFRNYAADNRILQEIIDSMEMLSDKYIEQTRELPTLKKEILIKSVKVNKNKASFIGLAKTLNREETYLYTSIDDSFLRDSLMGVQAAQNIMENSTMKALNLELPEQIEKEFQTSRQYYRDFDTNMKDLRLEIKDLDNNIGTYVTAFLFDTTDDKGVLGQHLDLVKEQIKTEQMAQNAEDMINNIRTCIRQVQDISLAVIAESRSNAATSFNKSQIIQLIALIVAILIAGATANIVSHSIKLPLNRILKAISLMSTGDYTHEFGYNSTNEFGVLTQKMNMLREQFATILRNISSANKEINHAAAINQQSVDNTVKGIKSQQDMSDTVAASVDDLKSTGAQVADSAHQTYQIVLDAGTAVQNGCQIISDNIEATRRLAEKMVDTEHLINDVNAMSENIGAVIQVIKDVANRTNLLALNAAIEAARAGEHGRGFAVVADEVRSLATKTADATNEVKQVIDNLHEAIRKAVDSMNECSDEMEHSIDQTSAVNDAIGKINQSLETINKYTDLIVNATDAQESTTTEVAKNIHMIVGILEQNVHEIAKVTDACSDLNKLAQKQTDEVHKFKF